MFERTREKVLLALIAALLLVIVLDGLVVSPLLNYIHEANVEIAALSEELAHAGQTVASDALVRFDPARLRQADEQDQNEFRRHLESRLPPGASVRSSTRRSTTDVPGVDGLRQIAYRLEVEGPMSVMRVFLNALDRSKELLQIEHLVISRAAEEEKTLSVKITISTMAHGPASAERTGSPG